MSEIKICQVKDPEMYLPCKVYVDEFRCEELGDHEVHKIGQHTIRHAIVGNKFNCDFDNGKKQKEMSVKKFIPSSRLSVIMVFGIILPLIIAATYNFVITPKINDFKENRTLSDIKNASGPVTLLNSKSVSFEKGKALTDGGKVTSPQLTFWNGKTKDAKDITIYIDFVNSKSNALIQMNANYIKTLITSGKAKVTFVTVPSENSYAVYATMALFKIAAKDPDKAFDGLTALASAATNIGTKSNKGKESIAAIKAGLDKIGLVFSDKELLSTEYINWIQSVSKDSHVKNGILVPSISVNDEFTKLETINLQTNDGFKKLMAVE